MQTMMISMPRRGLGDQQVADQDRDHRERDTDLRAEQIGDQRGTAVRRAEGIFAHAIFIDAQGGGVIDQSGEREPIAILAHALRPKARATPPGTAEN